MVLLVFSCLGRALGQQFWKKKSKKNQTRPRDLKKDSWRPLGNLKGDSWSHLGALLGEKGRQHLKKGVPGGVSKVRVLGSRASLLRPFGLQAPPWQHFCFFDGFGAIFSTKFIGFVCVFFSWLWATNFCKISSKARAHASVMMRRSSGLPAQ